MTAIVYNPPEWTSGDTESLSYTVADEFGTLIDLTDYTGTMQIRQTVNGVLVATADAVIDTATSTVSFTFPPAQTVNFRAYGAGNYVYDAETVSAGGVTTTDVKGVIPVILDVTRAAATASFGAAK